MAYESPTSSNTAPGAASAQESASSQSTPAEPRYRGRVEGSVLVVTRPDGRELDKRLDLKRHSPTGFACGYSGSGPAQLALALLADRYPDVLAVDHYQRFESEVVAQLDPGGWALPAIVVEGFIPEEGVANVGPSTTITEHVGQEPAVDGSTHSYTYYRCEECGAESVGETMQKRGCWHCEDQGERIITDGGVISPEVGRPGVPTVIEDVIEDAQPGGLERQILIERAAEIAEVTQQHVDEVIARELERGDIYRMDDVIKPTASPRDAAWGGSR